MEPSAPRPDTAPGDSGVAAGAASDAGHRDSQGPQPPTRAANSPPCATQTTTADSSPRQGWPEQTHVEWVEREEEKNATVLMSPDTQVIPTLTESPPAAAASAPLPVPSHSLDSSAKGDGGSGGGDQQPQDAASSPPLLEVIGAAQQVDGQQHDSNFLPLSVVPAEGEPSATTASASNGVGRGDADSDEERQQEEGAALGHLKLKMTWGSSKLDNFASADGQAPGNASDDVIAAAARAVYRFSTSTFGAGGIADGEDEEGEEGEAAGGMPRTTTGGSQRGVATRQRTPERSGGGGGGYTSYRGDEEEHRDDNDDSPSALHATLPSADITAVESTTVNSLNHSLPKKLGFTRMPYAMQQQRSLSFTASSHNYGNVHSPHQQQHQQPEQSPGPWTANAVAVPAYPPLGPCSESSFSITPRAPATSSASANTAAPQSITLSAGPMDQSRPSSFPPVPAANPGTGGPVPAVGAGSHPPASSSSTTTTTTTTMANRMTASTSGDHTNSTSGSSCLCNVATRHSSAPDSTSSGGRGGCVGGTQGSGDHSSSVGAGVVAGHHLNMCGSSSGGGADLRSSVSGSFRLRSSHGSSSLGKRNESMMAVPGGGGGLGPMMSSLRDGSSFAGSMSLGHGASVGSRRSRGGYGPNASLSGMGASGGGPSGASYYLGRSASGAASFSGGRNDAEGSVSPPLGTYFGDDDNSELVGTFDGHQYLYSTHDCSHENTLSDDTFGTLVSTVYTMQRSGQSSSQQPSILPPSSPREVSISTSPTAIDGVKSSPGGNAVANLSNGSAASHATTITSATVTATTPTTMTATAAAAAAAAAAASHSANSPRERTERRESHGGGSDDTSSTGRSQHSREANTSSAVAAVAAAAQAQVDRQEENDDGSDPIDASTTRGGGNLVTERYHSEGATSSEQSEVTGSFVTSVPGGTPTAATAATGITVNAEDEGGHGGPPTVTVPATVITSTLTSSACTSIARAGLVAPSEGNPFAEEEDVYGERISITDEVEYDEEGHAREQSSSEAPLPAPTLSSPSSAAVPVPPSIKALLTLMHQREEEESELRGSQRQRDGGGGGGAPQQQRYSPWLGRSPRLSPTSHLTTPAGVAHGGPLGYDESANGAAEPSLPYPASRGDDRGLPHHPSFSYHGLPNSQVPFGNRHTSVDLDDDPRATDHSGSKSIEGSAVDRDLSGVVVGVPQGGGAVGSCVAPKDAGPSLASTSLVNAFTSATTAVMPGFSEEVDHNSYINVGESLLSGMALISSSPYGHHDHRAAFLTNRSEGVAASHDGSGGWRHATPQNEAAPHTGTRTAQDEGMDSEAMAAATDTEGQRGSNANECGPAALQDHTAEPSHASFDEKRHAETGSKRGRRAAEEDRHRGSATATATNAAHSQGTGSPISTTRLPLIDELGNSLVSFQSADWNGSASENIAVSRRNVGGSRGEGNSKGGGHSSNSSRPHSSAIHESIGIMCCSAPSVLSRDRDTGSTSWRTATYGLADGGASSTTYAPPGNSAAPTAEGGNETQRRSGVFVDSPNDTDGDGRSTGGHGRGDGNGDDSEAFLEDELVDTLTPETKATVAELSREVVAEVLAEQVMLLSKHGESGTDNATCLADSGPLPGVRPPHASRSVADPSVPCDPLTSSTADDHHDHVHSAAITADRHAAAAPRLLSSEQQRPWPLQLSAGEGEAESAAAGHGVEAPHLLSSSSSPMCEQPDYHAPSSPFTVSRSNPAGASVTSSEGCEATMGRAPDVGTAAAVRGNEKDGSGTPQQSLCPPPQSVVSAATTNSSGWSRSRPEDSRTSRVGPGSTSRGSAGTISADGGSSWVGGSFSTRAFYSDTAIPYGSISARSDYALNSARSNANQSTTGAGANGTESGYNTNSSANNISSWQQLVPATQVGAGGRELESSIVSSARSHRAAAAAAAAVVAVLGSSTTGSTFTPPQPSPLRFLISSDPVGDARRGVQQHGMDSPTHSTSLYGEDTWRERDAQKDTGSGAGSHGHDSTLPEMRAEAPPPPPPPPVPPVPAAASSFSSSNPASASHTPSSHRQSSQREGTRVPGQPTSSSGYGGSGGGGGRRLTGSSSSLNDTSNRNSLNHPLRPPALCVPVPAPSSSYQSLSARTSTHATTNNDASQSHSQSLTHSARRHAERVESVLSLSTSSATSASSSPSLSQPLDSAQDGEKASNDRGAEKDDPHGAESGGPIPHHHNDNKNVFVDPSVTHLACSGAKPTAESKAAEEEKKDGDDDLFTVPAACPAASENNSHGSHTNSNGHDEGKDGDDDDGFGDFGEVRVVAPLTTLHESSDTATTTATAASGGVAPAVPKDTSLDVARDPASPDPDDEGVAPQEDAAVSAVELVSVSFVSPDSFWGTQLAAAAVGGQGELGRGRRSCLRSSQPTEGARVKSARLSDAPPAIVPPQGEDFALDDSYFFNPMLDYCEGSDDSDRDGVGEARGVESHPPSSPLLREEDVVLARRIARSLHHNTAHGDGGVPPGGASASSSGAPDEAIHGENDDGADKATAAALPSALSSLPPFSSSPAPRAPLVRRVQLPSRKSAAAGAAASSSSAGIALAMPASAISFAPPPPPPAAGVPVALALPTPFAPPPPPELPSQRKGEEGKESKETGETGTPPAEPDGVHEVPPPAGPPAHARPASAAAATAAAEHIPAEEKHILARIAEAEAAADAAHARLEALGSADRVAPTPAPVADSDGEHDKDEVGGTHQRSRASPWRRIPAELAAHLETRRSATNAAREGREHSIPFHLALVERIDALLVRDQRAAGVPTSDGVVDEPSSPSLAHNGKNGVNNSQEERKGGEGDGAEPALVSRAADTAVPLTLSALGFHPLRNRELLDAAIPVWAGMRPPSPSPATTTSAVSPATSDVANDTHDGGGEGKGMVADDSRRASDLRARYARGKHHNNNNTSSSSGGGSFALNVHTSLTRATLRALYPGQAATASSSANPSFTSPTDRRQGDLAAAHLREATGGSAGNDEEEETRITPADVMLLLQEQRRWRAREEGRQRGVDGERESLADVLAAAAAAAAVASKSSSPSSTK